MAKGPTPDFDQVLLKWAGVDLDGTPSTGRLEVSYNGGVMLDDDATLPVSIYPTLLVATLTTKNEVVDGAVKPVGYAEFAVPASDDPDIQGSGGTYTVVERLTNGRGVTRVFLASKDATNGVIWLNRLTSVNPVIGQVVSAVSVAEFTALKNQVAGIATSPGGGTALSSYSQVSGLTGYPTAFPPAGHQHPQTDVTGLAATLLAKADLVGGKIPTNQLPAVAISEYLGTVASNAQMQALVAQRGDFTTRTDTTVMGDGLAATGDWILTSDVPANLADWHRLTGPSTGISSVAGKTDPAVTLVKGDVGLGAVDNTADSAKPISAAQAAAFAVRVRFDAAQSLTDDQKAQVKTNLGVIDGSTGVQRRNASETTRGYPTTTPLDIFDDRLTGVPPTWFQPGLDVLLSSV